MEYVIDEPLRLAVTRAEPVVVPLPVPPSPLLVPPHDDAIPNWTATDIGDAVPGGQRLHADGALTVYGGGSDIWGEADSFRFLHRREAVDFTLTATVTSLGDTHDFAKAGLMVRSDLSPGAAHVMVHVIPGGRVVLGHRDLPGGRMAEESVEAVPFPVRLRLSRRGDLLIGEYAAGEQGWQRVGTPLTVPALAGPCPVGIAVLSHRREGLTEAIFADVISDHSPAEGHPPASSSRNP
jgi:hypothetical protein